GVIAAVKEDAHQCLVVAAGRLRGGFAHGRQVAQPCAGAPQGGHGGGMAKEVAAVFALHGHAHLVTRNSGETATIRMASQTRRFKAVLMASAPAESGGMAMLLTASITLACKALLRGDPFSRSAMCSVKAVASRATRRCWVSCIVTLRCVAVTLGP